MLFSSIPGITQENKKNLHLINPNNSAARMIKEGRRIKVWMKDEKKPYKGNYSVVSDHSILINQDTLRLEDIEAIRVATRQDRNGAAAGGSIPLLVTVYLLSAGIYLKIQASDFLDLSDLALIGSSITAVPSAIAIIGFVYGKKRSVKWNWQWKIM